MTPVHASLSARPSLHDAGAGHMIGPNAFDALSDEAAVQRLFDLGTRGARNSAEFARLDALVYGRLMATYERGGGTRGIIRRRAGRVG